MKYVLCITIIASLTFGVQMFHDPEAWVRVWATIGFGVSIIAAMIAVVSFATPPQPR